MDGMKVVGGGIGFIASVATGKFSKRPSDRIKIQFNTYSGNVPGAVVSGLTVASVAVKHEEAIAKHAEEESKRYYAQSFDERIYQANQQMGHLP